MFPYEYHDCRPGEDDLGVHHIGGDPVPDNCAKTTCDHATLVTAGLGEAISGCIMFEETLYQSTEDGKQFVDVLKEQGIVPGIKVDTGDPQASTWDDFLCARQLKLHRWGALCEQPVAPGTKHHKM